MPVNIALLSVWLSVCDVDLRERDVDGRRRRGRVPTARDAPHQRLVLLLPSGL
jgi:hypothetical protein